jgi:hypothetical protein
VVNVDVAAFWPSLISTLGQAVTEAEEADPMNLFLAVNDDDDNGDGVVDNEGASASSIDAEDDEMAALIVRQFAPSGLTGTLTMEIPSGLRLFSAAGAPVSTPVTVDLSAPTGPLAGILTGDVTFLIEATATSSDAAVVLRFTPSVGASVTDAVHMTLTSTDVTGSFTRGSVQYAAAIKHAGRWYAGGTLDSNHPLSVLIPVPTGMVSVTTAQLEYRLESGTARMAVRLNEAYFQEIADFWNVILGFLRIIFPLWNPEPYTASYIANELYNQTGISVAELMDGHYFCMMNLDTAGLYQLTYSKGSTTPFSKEWLAVLNVDIAPVETNVTWNTNNAVLNLSTNSYWGPDYGGSVIWSSTPAGLSGSGSGGTFTFNPSASPPGEYTVKAWSSLLTNCIDICTVRVLKVRIEPAGTNVCWPLADPITIWVTNSYAPGGITWSGTNGLNVVSADNDKLIFLPTNSLATNYAVKADATEFPNCFDTATVNVYRVELTPRTTNVWWQTSNPVEIVLTNSYAPGGIIWSGTNGLKVISATDAKLVFTPTNSVATNYVVKAAATAFTNCYDTCTVNVYRVELTPKATNVCWQTTTPVEIVLTNSYAPGGITWSGTNGLKVVSATDAKLVFTPTNSVATNYAVKATAVGSPNCYDVCTVNVYRVELTPDATNVCWQSSNPVEIVLTNSYAPGGITWSGTNGLKVVSATDAKLVFTPTNSVATNYAVKATATGFTNCYDVCTVNVYRVEVTPDATNVCWQTTAPVEIVLTNSYAPGGITWSGTNGLKVISATDAKLVFTPTNSTATNYAVKAASVGSPNCYDVCTVNVYRVELTPDATNVCWQTTNPVEIVLTNSYAPDGITWSGTNGLKVVSATDAKLVFTPTNSTPTNYAVKAASTGSPNCYDVCTVNVYRVELTPKATNVCWLSSNPVEIVLTNSYAPGGITWSGTNGLHVISACDTQLVFTATNSMPGDYIVKAAAAVLSDAYDTASVGIRKADIVQTQVVWSVGLSNNAPFNLTTDSSTNVIWTIMHKPGTGK